MRFPLRRTRRSVGKEREEDGDSGPRGGDSPRKLKRRWLQFSLRSLLLFTLLCAVGLSLWKIYVADYYRQKAAIEELKRLGIRFDTEPADGPGWVGWIVGEDHYRNVVSVVEKKEHFRGNRRQRLLWAIERLPFIENLHLRGTFTDSSLRCLEGKRHLERLRLSYSRIRGHGFRYLREAENLRVVSVHKCTSFTDAGLEHLKNHTELTTLHLSYTRVTDGGMAVVGNFAHLEDLTLDETAVTDEGLAHLQNLRELKSVCLDRTPITDAGLGYLAASPSLKYLRLNGTGTRGEGLVSFANHSTRLFINLDGTEVNDETLEFLLELPENIRIGLTNTRVSQAALERLRDLRPHLHIFK